MNYGMAKLGITKSTEGMKSMAVSFGKRTSAQILLFPGWLDL